MLRGGLLLAALALAAPVAAEEEAPVEEPTLAVVEFTRAAPFIGVPVGCYDPDRIFLTELYEGQATPVRHIFGEELPRRFTLRFPAHSVRVKPGLRMLVWVNPFEDGDSEGYFASWWDLERFDGLFCETEEGLERFPEGPLRTAFENGVPRHGRETAAYDAADYLCIWSD